MTKMSPMPKIFQRILLVLSLLVATLVHSQLSIGVLELLRNLMVPRLQESVGWMSFALPMQYYLVTYAALILVGVIIGLFGSAIAMRRYLRV